jgi:hypothetical protein
MIVGLLTTFVFGISSMMYVVQPTTDQVSDLRASRDALQLLPDYAKKKKTGTNGHNN